MAAARCPARAQPVLLAQGNWADSVDSPCVVVIITTINSKQLIKALENDGWTLRGVKGSHHVYTHPTKPGHVTIPHPRKDLGTGLVKAILKQAGLA